MALNSCDFQGRLTADPKLELVGNNKVERVTFSLAVDRDRKKEDGSRETDFLDFIAWRGTAKFISGHFHKGDGMLVSNSQAEVREYKDKNGAIKRKTEYVIGELSRVYFAGPRRNRPENTWNYSDTDFPTDNMMEEPYFNRY